MKAIKSLAKRIFTSAILTLAFVTPVAASDYAGWFCIDLMTDAEPSFTAFQVAVSTVSPGTYLLNGISTNLSTAGIGSVVGNASMVGDKITMTLRESHTNVFGMSESTYHFNLDVSTLSGSFESIAQYFNGRFEAPAHLSGTASLYSCEYTPVGDDDIDNDLDGFSENGGDCNDLDNTINPYATDRCGDGIDQDCNGFDRTCVSSGNSF